MPLLIPFEQSLERHTLIILYTVVRESEEGKEDDEIKMAEYEPPEPKRDFKVAQVGSGVKAMMAGFAKWACERVQYQTFLFGLLTLLRVCSHDHA